MFLVAMDIGVGSGSAQRHPSVACRHRAVCMWLSCRHVHSEHLVRCVLEFVQWVPMTRDILLCIVNCMKRADPNETSWQDVYGPVEEWNMSNVTDLSFPAGNRPLLPASFNYNVEWWDVSNVVTMTELFCRTDFNQPLLRWNVSAVTDMSKMFFNCTNFNQPLHTWNVSNVMRMDSMFAYCVHFNQPLCTWDVSNVTRMDCMFAYCVHFNQPLHTWNVSNVRMFRDLFNSCNSLQQDMLPLIKQFLLDAKRWVDEEKRKQTFCANYISLPNASRALSAVEEEDSVHM